MVVVVRDCFQTITRINNTAVSVVDVDTRATCPTGKNDYTRIPFPPPPHQCANNEITIEFGDTARSLGYVDNNYAQYREYEQFTKRFRRRARFVRSVFAWHTRPSGNETNQKAATLFPFFFFFSERTSKYRRARIS